MKRSLDVRRVASWIGQTAVEGVIQNAVWWGLLSLVVLLAGSVFLVYRFWSALSDFSQADLRVWHLILTLLLVGLGAYAARLWSRRRGSATDATVGAAPKRRRYVRFKDVDWDMFGVAPRCPKDHAYLAWAVTPDDEQPLPYVRQASGGPWDDLKDGSLRFACLKCGAKYDLNGNGSMSYLRMVVRTLSEADE